MIVASANLQLDFQHPKIAGARPAATAPRKSYR
jgi:hypothetical protein